MPLLEKEGGRMTCRKEQGCGWPGDSGNWRGASSRADVSSPELSALADHYFPPAHNFERIQRSGDANNGSHLEFARLRSPRT